MDSEEDDVEIDHCYTTQIVKEQDCYNANNASRSDFIERLIAEVFSRETLWNSVLPYKLRGPSETKSLWTEIDTSLDVNPGTSQVKWKNLRDRFVKEHAIQCTYIASGSGLVKKKSTWPFYESLCFLIPTINYRKTISNIENINPSKMLLLSQTKDISSPVPSTSNITKKGSSTSYQSISVQKSVLNTQLQSKKKASRQDSDSSNISEMETTSRAKGIKKPKIVDQKSVSTRCEEAILKELERTRPKDEVDTKPDKIASFTKYLEACLREMTADVSKHVMNAMLKLILEADV